MNTILEHCHSATTVESLKAKLKDDYLTSGNKKTLFNRYVYSLYTIKDLKELLKINKIKTTGNKTELVERVMESCNEQEQHLTISSTTLSRIVRYACAGQEPFTSPSKNPVLIQFNSENAQESKSTEEDSETASPLAPELQLQPAPEPASSLALQLEPASSLTLESDPASSLEPEDESDDDTCTTVSTVESSSSVAKHILKKLKTDKLQLISFEICKQKFQKKDDCIQAIIGSYLDYTDMFMDINYYVLFQTLLCKQDCLLLLANEFKISTELPGPKIVRLVAVTATADYNKKKKQAIPPALKHEMWTKYYGNLAEGRCFCCNQTIVCHPGRSNTHQAGHVLAEANGGLIELSNLRPVCKTCNTKMGVKHMAEYAREVGFTYAPILQEK